MKKLDDKQERSVGFLVDGKILNELSRQVSSHLFALGELMKNSYDAKSTKIDITFNKKERLLIVEDDGIGISSNDFSSLLHIAKSGKEYGQKFSFNRDKKTITRYTQGSKGLGLFCAFKFGDLVIWDTKSDSESSKLIVNKNEVIELSNISKIRFPISEGSREKIGTTITIAIDPNDEDINYIYDFFKDSKNSKKITSYFHESDIIVSINLINENGDRENEFPKTTQPKQQLNNVHLDGKVFDIYYNSEKSEIVYKYKDGRIKCINYKLINTLKDFKVDLHINAYQLKTGGVKKISSIFHNNRNELSPLVYINGVMFNSDQFFDPSITRKISNSQVLSQLTGFIQVICTNHDLQFNNERTDLIKNYYNEKIRENINDLNKEIQLHGKSIMKEFGLVNGPFIVFSEPDLDLKSPAPNPVECIADKNTNSTFNDDSSVNPTPTPTPYIILKKNQHTIRFLDESETINICDYFKEAKDSKGNDVPVSKISISINDQVVNYNHIEPINCNQTLQVRFSFTDDFALNHENDPFKATSSLTLKFIKNTKSFQDDSYDLEPLISPIGTQSYTIKLKGVSKLISQINLLAENHEKYDMCIAASIRVLFDLTTYQYQQLSPKALINNNLEKQVEELIQRIIDENEDFPKVTKLIGPRHRLIKNMFVPGLFNLRVALSNLGAHTGSSHVSKEDIKDIAKYAGYYAQLVDAHCKIKGFINK